MSAVVARGQARELDYQRFCTYPQRQVLGADVEGQFFYLVQPYKISVYQYYGESKRPQLIEELIYNKLILNYAINQHYICILTSSFLEVRDRHNWNKLIHTHPVPQEHPSSILLLDQHLIYFSAWPNNCQLTFQRIDIIQKEAVDVISFGEILGGSTNKHPFFWRPIFLGQMGALSDFYICAKGARTLELGMLYSHKPKQKKKFQLSQIELKDQNLHQVYHHRVRQYNDANTFADFILLVGEQLQSKQLVVTFYQLSVKGHLQSTQQLNFDSLQCLISQMEYFENFGRQIDHMPTQNEEISESQGQALTSGKTVLILENMTHFESSFYKNGTLWVQSPQKSCQIQLITSFAIDRINTQLNPQEKSIVKSVVFHDKTSSKVGIGIYQGNMLFRQQTQSFIIGFEKELTESIAEQIIEDQDLEENNISDHKITEEIQQLCQSIIDGALDQRQKELSNFTNNQPNNISLPIMRVQSRKSPLLNYDKKTIESKVYSETHHQLREGTAEFGVQTDKISHHIDDIQEVEMLVAKYSSAVSVSCSKLKQNQLQKQKFDKEIRSIVENMAKTVIEPFLEERFVSLLDAKIKEISATISVILLSQLEAVNQIMKKIEYKDNHLRGRRIYDYARQVENIRNSVSGVFEALKERQINEAACKELVVEEARAFREKVQHIQQQIIEISRKNEASENEINGQVRQIMDLVSKMCSQEYKSYAEESEGEIDHSDSESSQGEREMRKNEESLSQKQSSFQEDVNQGQPSYRYNPRYPETFTKGYPSAKEKSGWFDSRRYPPFGYYPQFAPPPHPPQIPYCYPYGLQPGTVPFQPYFPPMAPMPMEAAYSCSSSVAGKKESKQKKRRK